MKRTLSLIFALVILVNVMSFGVYARETSSGRDELLNKACLAFPEYANKIKADTLPATAMARSTAPREVVYSDTRALSSTEYVAYTEYSDGLFAVDLLTVNASFNAQTSDMDTEQVGSATHFTVSIKATCSLTSSYFEVTNVKFTIYAYANDRITKAGSPSAHNPANSSGDKCTYVSSTLVSIENGSTPASLTYPLTFRYSQDSGDFFSTSLLLEVGNNTYSLSHINHP